MTQQDFLQAAVGKLTAMWPDRTAYTGPVPEGADDGFAVRVEACTQTEGLDRFRRRQARLQIRYFLSGGDAAVWAEWAEAMCAGFRTLEAADGAGARRVRLSDRQIQPGPEGRDCLFSCRADWCWWEADAQEQETMESLRQANQFERKG